MDPIDIDQEGMPSDEEWAKPLQDIPTSKKGHHRTIIHFDIDCFYAQVEMIRNPELKNKPLGIQQKNIVVTCNYIARQKGVTKLMYLTDAKRKCPDLVLVSGEDLTNYRNISVKISEFLQMYSPDVERLGFDENFVDVTEIVDHRIRNKEFSKQFSGHIFINKDSTEQPCSCGCKQRIQIGSQIAADVREALRKELDITCCAGISHNKLLAKLVGATHKPNQQTSILPHNALTLLSRLPSARSIPGIGSRLSKQLQAIGISSVKQLQSTDISVLDREFGSTTGQLMRELSFGVDDSPFNASGLPQSLSDEDSFKCCNDYVDAERRIRELLLSLLPRVNEDGRIPQTVRLTIRRVKKGQHKESRQCPVQASIFTKFQKKGCLETACNSLMPVLKNLFQKLIDVSKYFHLTLINLCFAKMSETVNPQQTINSFFSNCSNNNTTALIPEELSTVNVSTLQQDEISDKTETEKRSSEIPMDHYETNQSTLLDSLPDLPSIEKGYEDVKYTSNVSHLQQGDPSNKTETEKKSNEIHMDYETYKSTLLDSLSDSSSIEKGFEDVKNTEVNIGNETVHIIENIAVDDISESQNLVTENLTSKESSGNTVESSALKSLDELLPNEVDTKMVFDLPEEIQQTVLADYGIMVENLSDGKRFVLMSSKMSTRSTSSGEEIVKSRKRQLPQSRKSTKRSRSTTNNTIYDLKEKDTLAKELLLQLETPSVKAVDNLIQTSKVIDTPEITDLKEVITTNNSTVVCLDEYSISSDIEQANLTTPNESRKETMFRQSSGDTLKLSMEQIDSCPSIIIIDEKDDEIQDYMSNKISHSRNNLSYLTSNKVSLSSNKLGSPTSANISHSSNNLSSLTQNKISLSSNKLSSPTSNKVLVSSSKLSSPTSAKISLSSNKLSSPMSGKISLSSNKLSSPTSTKISLSSNKFSSPTSGKISLSSNKLSSPTSGKISLSSNKLRSPSSGTPTTVSHSTKVLSPPTSDKISLSSNKLSPPRSSKVSLSSSKLSSSTSDKISLSSSKLGSPMSKKVLFSSNKLSSPMAQGKKDDSFDAKSPRTSSGPSKEYSSPKSGSSSHPFKLPADIDPEVFSALPSNIRGEIMAHVFMGTGSSVNGESTSNSPPGQKKKTASASKTKQKSKNTLLTYFKKS